MSTEKAIPIFSLRKTGKQLAAWFNVVEYKDGLRNINRFRLAQLMIFCICVITSVTNYLSDLPYSFAITISGVFYTSFLQYLNNKGHDKVSRILFSVFLNFTAFLLCYSEGISSGAYFFYFLVVIIANFISAKEDYLELRVIYFFTFGMLALTFVLCPQESQLQTIDNEAEQINLYLNAVVSFSIAGILSYHMMKDNMLKEKSLISNQRYLDTVYNTSLDAVFIVDASNANIIDCNEQSLALFGSLSKRAICGKQLFSYFEDGDEGNLELLNQLLYDPQATWKGELTCQTHDNKAFAGYISMVPLVYDGKLLKKINILDISDIKQAQAALLSAKEKAEQAVFARTRFVSNMSHELRTPLNGIIGAANILIQQSAFPEQKPYFDVLRYSSEHMLNLINEVLDFSKIEAGKMDLERTTFDLHQLVENVYSLFRNQFEEKHLAYELQFDEQLATKSYIGDPTRLSQVLSNLISNAHKFTASGKVTLSVTQVTQSSHACTIRFKVTDTGIGIPKEKQVHIFDSFTQVESATTRKFGGTGLGLTISAKLVELYGGKLELLSEPGKGSSFYFTIQLDVQHYQQAYLNEDRVRLLQSLNGIRVLLAEDNPINMMIAKAVLEKWDVKLVEAVNGKEAWELYKEQEFDLLLLDLEMPEMDGFELLNLIRAENKQIPAIAFTAALFENMQAHLINKGFTDYVQKPFRPEDLHAKIARYSPVKAD